MYGALAGWKKEEDRLDILGGTAAEEEDADECSCAVRALEESFSTALGGRPEYPHYTRPADYRGWKVPDVLLSGDHARIAEWRREQSRARTAR